MNGRLAGFIAYEEPPTLRDLSECTTWLQRIRNLAELTPGDWSKFGPYFTKKSAQNAGSRATKHIHQMGYRGDQEVHMEDDEAYLYIRVWKEDL